MVAEFPLTLFLPFLAVLTLNIEHFAPVISTVPCKWPFQINIKATCLVLACHVIIPFIFTFKVADHSGK